MKIVKICCSEWINENRDKRELSVCKELGMDVLVIAKGNAEDKGRVEIVDGYEVRRLSTRPLGNKMPNSINRIISIFTWAKYTKTQKADIISGHDLSGLTIAWISTWFVRKSNKAKLVYDSHEFELGRNTKRNNIVKSLVCIWERFMIKKSHLVMMVNDSIADEVMRIHKLDKRPLVVRNMTNRWTIDEEESRSVRQLFLEQMDAGINFLAMYHGALSKGRGIEIIIEAVKKCDFCGLVILGNANDDTYYNQLCQYVESSDNIVIHPAVPISELSKYVGAVDVGVVGMVNITPMPVSYYYGLPNKLFENIQATTPVVALDLPEFKRIVEGYDVGMVCKENNAECLANCLRKLYHNPKLLKQYRDNEIKAKEKLCWEEERKILHEAYTSLSNAR